MSEQTTLTADEREALRRTWDFGPFGTETHQFAAVERILADRVANVREQIATELETHASTASYRGPEEITDAYLAAACIVRAAR